MTANGVLKCARCGRKILQMEGVVFLGSGDYHASCVVQVLKGQK
jgi:predicted nucleic acid-binding Zn ribbon protein